MGSIELSCGITFNNQNTVSPYIPNTSILTTKITATISLKYVVSIKIKEKFAVESFKIGIAYLVQVISHKLVRVRCRQADKRVLQNAFHDTNTNA